MAKRVRTKFDSVVAVIYNAVSKTRKAYKLDASDVNKLALAEATLRVEAWQALQAKLNAAFEIVRQEQAQAFHDKYIPKRGSKKGNTTHLKYKLVHNADGRIATRIKVDNNV